MNKIVLAGGSGYLGTVLARYFCTRAKQIVILSRTAKPTNGNIKTVQWDAKTLHQSWTRELEEADLLINLTGKNVNCRYTPENKKEIVDSRVQATAVLGEAIQNAFIPPRVWIQCASATIYRHAEDRAMDEDTGETGEGFSVEVCKAWEKTFCFQHVPATRKLLLRVGIVLGDKDGAFPRLLNLVRAGLGGRQGNGRQYISWIHEQDVAAIIHWLYAHRHMKGVYNVTSPTPITNEAFMRELRNTLDVGLGLPSPEWLLTLGAKVIGTEPELILKSRRVVPARLLAEGYTFKYPALPAALQALVVKENAGR